MAEVYRTAKAVAYAVGHEPGDLWDDIWRVCDRCGAVVIDTEQHDSWHDGIRT